MSTKAVDNISAAKVRDAIEIIATAELAQARGVNPAAVSELEPSEERFLKPPYQGAQGLDGVVERAMGAVELPSLIDLKSSVENVRAGLLSEPDIAVDVSSTVLAVLDEELLKIDRYIELRDQ